MRLLIDSDVLCRLCVTDLLNDAISYLGINIDDCRRLAALPYMLKKGKLFDSYGKELCDEMESKVTVIPTLEQPSDSWIDRFTGFHDVDAGEISLFASVAENGHLLLTGDKRAIIAIKDEISLLKLLAGRIFIFEDLLLWLIESQSLDYIRQKVQKLKEFDVMTKICFSDHNVDPVKCLSSYQKDLHDRVKPLFLWNPKESKK